MIVRTTARLLTVVMLLASGRLLACGWECIDGLAASAAAPCHQESAPETALNGGAAHPCLPEVVEPQVTVAKLTVAQTLLPAPVVTDFVTPERLPDISSHRLYSLLLGSASPHASASSVLRI